MTGGSPVRSIAGFADMQGRLAEERAGAIRLVMPMPPSLTNSGQGRSRHWRSVAREKKDYLKLCDAAWAIERWPKAPRAPLARVQLASVMYLGNAMDDDNAMARHKWPLDWLKAARYIVDDRRSCVTWAGIPDQIVRRGQRYRLELTLTPIAE